MSGSSATTRRTRRGRGAAVAAAAVLATGTGVLAPAAPATTATEEPYAGYVFVYFTGEDTADGEQVYLAASRGDDPLAFDELGGGRPVLTSGLGEQGVRDPFLIRSPAGDRFFLIATDLRIHADGDWDRAQRHGSRSIMIWESEDLVTWSDQRMVEVSPPTAGNTWAPEAIWDPVREVYFVFWASKLYSVDDPDHVGDSHHRMLYATTRDFVEFSEPAVWVDPGHSVIDSTLIEHHGTYYRFTKDERDASAGSPCGEYLVAERAQDLLDPAWELVAECIGRPTPDGPGIERGEGPTVFKSNTEDRWYLFIDEFGGRGYVPFETTDLAEGRWTMSSGYELPASPRHGTVLPITRTEHDRLTEALSAAALR
ncbi:hypothetical protein FHR81_004443 [Actinoalloteichus hoggarensis]|uniref:Glycosyl hydrolases family 43 n=1 Tax=Actinoalloteichus hoggarensis TaxID=1470176 RepID=A0A221W3K0_9PSEU|nr:glycoside hydrolase family 43 protein [Actinoalloteichus hoggarensis]ASO20334.1 Glycosyl hydrolases family 43 [Actinoalloteichus hoggarensis]MBB5923372.1 hypothetical protein [Actinoalloteichus hoggarensis]